MQRGRFKAALISVTAMIIAAFIHAQEAPKPADQPVIARFSAASNPLEPLKDAATVDQIHEYLKVSGELDSFKESWIAALKKNRIKGAPYWPDEFYAAIEDEMRKTDLEPMYVAFLQHAVSRDLMQEVLGIYQRLGREHFLGSTACFKLGNAREKANPEFERLKLAKTQEVFTRVYTAFKPQIKAARVSYLAEHPDYVHKYGTHLSGPQQQAPQNNSLNPLAFYYGLRYTYCNPQ